jgi:hypothetical protein
MQQEQDDRLSVTYASKGNSERPSLLLPLDRQAFASRHGRSFFPPCLDSCLYGSFAHNVVSITSPSVRDHHPQIGKLEIGMCGGLHGESEDEIKANDAQAMRKTTICSRQIQIGPDDEI